MAQAQYLQMICIGAAISIHWTFILKFSALKGLLSDKPNIRSSHTKVTIRGGGFAFSLSVFTAALLLGSYQEIYLASLGVALSVLGIIDDACNLRAKTRITFQSLICLLAVGMILQVETNTLSIATGVVFLIMFLQALSYINFYNFADGINGHAALQSVSTILSWLIFMSISREQYNRDAFQMFAALVGSLLIFIIANVMLKWVFMGDTGSTFLGFFIAIIPFSQLLY
ncbi:MAG: hypothetical protein EOP04_27665, partial [Proteobacteria bacterium]